MKKIALISTFCDNEEKLEILKENIKKIKSLFVDVMVFTPLNLTEEIIALCDYVIFSKENPVLNWPEKAYYQWYRGTINNKSIEMTTTYPDYGYAGLVQIKRMADLSLSMDYDVFFPMIYDIKIDEHVESVLRDNKKNSFFPSERDGMVWAVGLHLISLDREHLFRFKTLITKESYLIDTIFDAFAWLHRAIKLIPGVIEKKPVEDVIYFLENKNFFDCGLTNKYKCFIHKTGADNMKMVFYNYGGIKKYLISTDNFQEEYELREWEQIILPFIGTEKLIVSCDGEDVDYSTYIKSIGQNKLNISN
jgi:hypothetical protein